MSSSRIPKVEDFLKKEISQIISATSSGSAIQTPKYSGRESVS